MASLGFAGPLFVTAINTRGDRDGWINLPGEGVFVAEITDDNSGSLNSWSSTVQFISGIILVLALSAALMTYAVVNLCFKRHQGVALNEREFELTRRVPMPVSATQVMLCPDDDDDATGADNAESGYSLLQAEGSSSKQDTNTSGIRNDVNNAEISATTLNPLMVSKADFTAIGTAVEDKSDSSSVDQSAVCV